MKRALIVLLFLQWAFLGFSNSYTPSIAILDFAALEGINPAEAEQVGEIFLSEFSKFRIFNIVEQSQTSRLMDELNFQMSNLTAGSVIELGNRLNVDFLLTGSVGMINQEIVIYVRILSTADGSYFLGEMRKTNPGKLLLDIVDVTKLTVYRLSQRLSGDLILRIRSLIALGKIHEAEELIAYGKNIELYALGIEQQEEDLNLKALNFLTDTYKAALKENNLSHAEFILNEMLHYHLSTSRASELMEDLEKRKDVQDTKKSAELIKRIDSLIDRKNYNEAANSLAQLTLLYGSIESHTVVVLRNRLEVLKGELIYAKAKNEFSVYSAETLDYMESIHRLNQIIGTISEALLLEPANRKYLLFLSKLEKEKDRIVSREGSRHERIIFAESGLRSLVYCTAETGMNYISDPYFEYGGLTGIFPEIKLGGSLNFSLNRSLKGVFTGNLGYAQGTQQQNEGLMELDSSFRQVFVLLEPGFGYSFGVIDILAGAGMRLGFWWYESTRRESGISYNHKGVVFPLGPGFFISGRYNFSKSLGVSMIFRRYSLWYAGTGWFPETSVSLGIGYGIR